MTTSYSITSRSGAASSGAAEAEKHRARGARVLPHAVALLPVLLLLLVALAVVLRVGWAKGESVEVLAVASAASASTYLRPQRWLPVTRSGPAAKARRRDNMLPVEGMWGVGLGVNCGVKTSEMPLNHP